MQILNKQVRTKHKKVRNYNNQQGAELIKQGQILNTQQGLPGILIKRYRTNTQQGS
ncbi:hypothetical protein HYE32_03835 [Mycoplasmopsis bovis]|nr:hypothetical protein [Mycoplasmopsis bovis]QQH22365.1 hypothetical protein HYE32_03835 [Mycoplasmopsis bovis]